MADVLRLNEVPIVIFVFPGAFDGVRGQGPRKGGVGQSTVPIVTDCITEPHIMVSHCTYPRMAEESLFLAGLQINITVIDPVLTVDIFKDQQETPALVDLALVVIADFWIIQKLF